MAPGGILRETPKASKARQVPEFSQFSVKSLGAFGNYLEWVFNEPPISEEYVPDKAVRRVIESKGY